VSKNRKRNEGKGLIETIISVFVCVMLFNYLTPLNIAIIDNPNKDATIQFKIVIRSDNYVGEVTEDAVVEEPIREADKPNTTPDTEPIDENESKYEDDMFR